MLDKRWKKILAGCLLAGVLIAQQPIQLQTVNGGGAVALGHGTAAAALRVELPTDGTGQVTLASGATVALAAGSASVGTVGLNAGSNAIGTVQLLPQSTSTYALTAYDLAATAATNVKGSAGNVYGWYGYNPNASTCFLQFYNSTSATLGTSPLHQFGILAGASFNMQPGPVAIFNLSTGISTGQTTTATGSTQCGSAMVITIIYQ